MRLRVDDGHRSRRLLPHPDAPMRPAPTRISSDFSLGGCFHLQPTSGSPQRHEHLGTD